MVGFVKDGRHYSASEKRYCWTYRMKSPQECQKCGKICKDPVSLIWEDDEQNLEYLYGPECIKSLELQDAQSVECMIEQADSEMV